MSMTKFDSRRANETHFEELRYTQHDMPMQRCIIFFTTGRRISVSCTHVPWALRQWRQVSGAGTLNNMNNDASYPGIDGATVHEA